MLRSLATERSSIVLVAPPSFQSCRQEHVHFFFKARFKERHLFNIIRVVSMHLCVPIKVRLKGRLLYDATHHSKLLGISNPWVSNACLASLAFWWFRNSRAPCTGETFCLNHSSQFYWLVYLALSTHYRIIFCCAATPFFLFQKKSLKLKRILWN